MTLLKLNTLVMLLSSGLWSGAALGIAVERTNLWKRMPLDQYVVDFRRSILRMDPMQPILASIAAASAIVFAFNSDGVARALASTGASIALSIIVASITLAEPINSKFRRLPEGQAPERAEYYRAFWDRFHAMRNIAGLVMVICLMAAVVI